MKGTGTSQADSLRKHRAFGRSAGERRQMRCFCLTGFTASHNQSFILRNPAISCALTQSIIQMMDYIYCIYCMLCYKEYCMQIYKCLDCINLVSTKILLLLIKLQLILHMVMIMWNALHSGIQYSTPVFSGCMCSK